MNEQFEPLEVNEIITIAENHEYRIIISHPTFRVCEFANAALNFLKEGVVKNRTSFRGDLFEKWFQTGIDCEILKRGAKDWQKGKIRIRVCLEFCPDEPEREERVLNNQPEVSEPESPLDDLRRMLNTNNSK